MHRTERLASKKKSLILDYGDLHNLLMLDKTHFSLTLASIVIVGHISLYEVLLRISAFPKNYSTSCTHPQNLSFYLSNL